MNTSEGCRKCRGSGVVLVQRKIAQNIDGMLYANGNFVISAVKCRCKKHG